VLNSTERSFARSTSNHLVTPCGITPYRLFDEAAVIAAGVLNAKLPRVGLVPAVVAEGALISTADAGLIPELLNSTDATPIDMARVKLAV